MTPATGAHWATDYIGLPWVAEKRDCWAFFRAIQADHYGIVVPVIDVDAMDLHAVARAFRDHDERASWAEVSEPQDGDAVLMAHARYPSHVGVWIDVDGGRVLHCQQGAGVVCSSREALRLSGWGRVSFYRRVG